MNAAQARDACDTRGTCSSRPARRETLDAKRYSQDIDDNLQSTPTLSLSMPLLLL